VYTAALLAVGAPRVHATLPTLERPSKAIWQSALDQEVASALKRKYFPLKVNLKWPDSGLVAAVVMVMV